MDVARMNFSHGDHADHEAVYQRVREASDASGRAVGILADLQGPKIRLGRFADGPVEWANGEQVSITTDDIVGDHDRVSTTYKGLASDARPGDRLLIDDGKVGLVVHDVRGHRRHLHRGRGRPGLQQQGHLAARHERLRAGDVGEGHRRPALRAEASGVDFIALSLRPLAGRRRPGARRDGRDGRCARKPVIAKLEKPEAVGQSGGHRARLRRRHGGPRRPRRRAAAGAGAAGPEAGDHARPGERQAGHRRHPDARLDDRALPARPAPRRPTWPTRCWTAPTR